jgi:hypothetical protein
MHYLVVNLDKQQYFRPIALGARHATRCFSVALSSIDDLGLWPLFLAQLLDCGTKLAGPPEERPWTGSWAGDRFLIVREQGTSPSLMPQNFHAMKALRSKRLTPYQYARTAFKDVTPTLQQWAPAPLWHGAELFRRITRPSHCGWVNATDLEGFLDRARKQGDAFRKEYVFWLSWQPGLQKAVRDRLRKV